MVGQRSCQSPRPNTQRCSPSLCLWPSEEVTTMLGLCQTHFRFCLIFSSPLPEALPWGHVVLTTVALTWGTVSRAGSWAHSRAAGSSCGAALGASGHREDGEEGAAPAFSVLGASRCPGGSCQIRG